MLGHSSVPYQIHEHSCSKEARTERQAVLGQDAGALIPNISAFKSHVCLPASQQQCIQVPFGNDPFETYMSNKSRLSICNSFPFQVHAELAELRNDHLLQTQGSVQGSG